MAQTLRARKYFGYYNFFWKYEIIDNVYFIYVWNQQQKFNMQFSADSVGKKMEECLPLHFLKNNSYGNMH